MFPLCTSSFVGKMLKAAPATAPEPFPKWIPWVGNKPMSLFIPFYTQKHGKATICSELQWQSPEQSPALPAPGTRVLYFGLGGTSTSEANPKFTRGISILQWWIASLPSTVLALLIIWIINVLKWVSTLCSNWKHFGIAKSWQIPPGFSCFQPRSARAHICISVSHLKQGNKPKAPLQSQFYLYTELGVVKHILCQSLLWVFAV